MPLSSALHWIASAGFSIDFPDDLASDSNQELRRLWHDAARKFANAVASGKLSVVGIDSDGKSETLDRLLFAAVKWRFWFEITQTTRRPARQFAETPHVAVWPYVNDGEWHGDLNDQFLQAAAVRWKKLQVEKSFVRNLWPRGDSIETPVIYSEKKRRSTPARARVLEALKQIWPAGVVPDDAAISNKQLHSRVAKFLKDNGMDAVSEDSVLRAAGRRK